MPDLEHSRPLDVHRWSAFPEVRHAVKAVLRRLRGTEAARGGRASLLERHLTVVLIDLYFGYLCFENGYTAHSRSPNSYAAGSRYNKLRIAYRPLMRVIDGLADLGLIEHHLGFHDRRPGGQGRQSRMRATPALIRIIETHCVTQDMIGRAEGEEVIILRDADGDDIEYTDTDETRRMRAFVNAYNTALARADIRLSAEGIALVQAEGIAIDFSRTVVRRIFSHGHFELGGRFYGPWWQSIPKQVRAHLLINGLATVERDYRAQHIHILYGMRGKRYADFHDDGDPYALPGHDDVDRSFLKRVLLIALNAQDERAALQAIQSEQNRDPGDRRYTQTQVRAMIASFTAKHATIADTLYTGTGLRLQRLDSDIAEHVVGTALNDGILTLSLHDGFIVDGQYDQVLIDTMIKVFHKLNLVSIPQIT